MFVILTIFQVFNYRIGNLFSDEPNYLNINNQQAGPYEVEAVNQMLLSNQITAETLAWKQGMANWESLTCDTFKLLGVGGQSTSKSGSLSPQGGNITQTNQLPGQKEKSLKQSVESAKGGTFQIGKVWAKHFFFKGNMCDYGMDYYEHTYWCNSFSKSYRSQWSKFLPVCEIIENPVKNVFRRIT